ncbi:MAG: hypothetical protein HKO68_20580 [Desulfobacterales bacterium]|nr:hypothetical protein [Deltaproteobacteria bacterium]NNL78737.1 hypothetical protein [Desulfobacterales bacterium]
MSYPAYDTKRHAPVQTYESLAKLRVVKEQKSINLKEEKPVPQGILKRAILSMPLWFMMICLAIWSFTIIGFFVSFLLKLA